MLLTFRKEQEHGIYISKTIDNEQDIMYPVYRQATEALRSIVRQAQAFRDDAWQTDGIYGYCHNIIAFSGSRGQGKTSAMLSFSRALENSFDAKSPGRRDDPLCKCGFTVLPPIDPTVLEQDQSILAVILSRMYRQAEKEWTSACNRHMFSDDSSAGEAQRNVLLRLFQQCLTGINNVKFRKGEEIRGLIEMHEISDSTVLKDNFNKLTTKLLEFIRRDENGVTPFLVVQLDDTDFQVRKGYEIMEDIRKYLTIPNVIILMATDLNMLRATLTQHLVRDFYLKMDRENLKGIVDVNKLWKIESKHLDKLIPPSRAICLPHLDNLIRQQSENIRIEYLERDRGDILLPPSPGDKSSEKNLSLQESVFQFVYQKTRIVFTDSKTGLHKVLPTTLRGLAQFLVVLSSMRSVPEINDLKKLNDPPELAKLVSEQLEILETNLSLFENYFLNDWIHAKLPVEKARLFETLTTTEMERQYWCAVMALQKLYEEGGKAQQEPHEHYRYEDLMDYLQKLEGRFLGPDDRYVFFAVRMFFDLQVHKMVARKKRLAVAEQKRSNELMIFDFSQCAEEFSGTLHSSGAFRLSGTGWEALSKDLRKDQCDRILRALSSKNKSFGKILLRDIGNGVYHFDPFYFIPFFLSLGKDKTIIRGETDQRSLYLVQTTCATIAINKDVQDAVRKALKENPPPATDKSDYWALLTQFFNVVSSAIERINAGAEGNARMVASWIGEIPGFMEEKNRSEFQSLLARLRAELTRDHLQSLELIYHLAGELFRAASEYKDAMETQDLWRAFVEAGMDYSNVEIEAAGLDLRLLQDLLESPASDSAAAAGDFWKEFEREFQALCRHLGYPMSMFKKRMKKIIKRG